MRNLVLLCLILNFQIAFSQSDFIIIVRYDHLRVSPEGDSLAFRAVVCQEAQPYRAPMHIFLFPSLNSSPICLDPPVERFAISPGGKFLSFSSPFGLYLMTLDNEPHTVQIIERKINENWKFGFFDFTPDGKFLVVEIVSGNSQKEIHQIQIPENLSDSKFISFLNVNKKKVHKANLQDQTLVHYAGKFLSHSFANQDYFIGFIEDQSTQFPGDYNLIFSKDGKQKQLAKNCRPRILAPNADSTLFFISLFEKNRNLSYILNVKSEEFIYLAETFVVAAGWLDSARIVFLQEKNLFLCDTEKRETQLLSNWRFPQWCEKIPLETPKFQIATGSFLEKSKADTFMQMIIGLGMAPKIEFSNEGKSKIYFGEFSKKSEAKMFAQKLPAQICKFEIMKVDNPFDLYNLIGGNETKPFADGIVRIQYKKNFYLSNQVIYVNKNADFWVLLPSMNTSDE